MSARAITIAGYVLIAIAILTLELLGRRRGSRVPTIGHVLSRIMRTRSGRVGVVAGWAWFGMHFFVR